jgi:tRNA(adenine34) deaminase
MSAPEADLAFMQLALEHAREAERQREVPVGAVLVDTSGAVLAAAGNATIRLNDPTAHAEILALRAGGIELANYRLTGSTLYVTLEPCPMCASALVHARVARLVFAATDPKTGACGSIMDLVRHERLNHRLEVARGVLGEESGDLLKRFFRSRR